MMNIETYPTIRFKTLCGLLAAGHPAGTYVHWVDRRVNSSQIPELNEPSRAPTFVGSGRALRK